MVSPALAKRRAERAKRRKRYDSKISADPAYERSLFFGDLMRQNARPVSRSKYDPVVCRVDGKR